MSHLTLAQRYPIATLRAESYSQSQIATRLGVNRSTISREYSRNQSGTSYQAEKAHKKALKRCKRGVYKAKGARWQVVVEALGQQHSPAQIVGRLRQQGQVSLSHQTIYTAIYADRLRGGQLFKDLRRGHKRRRKRRVGKDRRGGIPHRVSIEQRPAEVETKLTLGHWEGDTVVGAERQGGILTLVERVTKVLRMAYLPQATAQAVEAATIELLKDVPGGVKTITFDNGKEVTYHQNIAQRLECQVYFAHPYSPWERGLNENTNGLLRQYIPKKVPLLVLTPQRLGEIQNLINHRPRQTLGFLTPLEFLDQKLKN